MEKRRDDDPVSKGLSTSDLLWGAEGPRVRGWLWSGALRSLVPTTGVAIP